MTKRLINFTKQYPFVLILIAYLFLGILYSIIIPLGEAPDEVPHFTYILHIAQNGRLPEGAEEHEAFQPPLYYILGALTTFWIDSADFVIKANADFSFTDESAPKNLLLHTSAESFPYHSWALAWHLVRLLSVLMGTVTVWATYRLGLELFPQHRSIALGAAALNAFIPGFIFISSVVNNDNAATMFSSLILLQLARMIKGAIKPKDPIILGLLLGLGALSKSSLLAFIPTTIIATGLVALRQSSNLSSSLRRGMSLAIVTFSVTFLIAGWWFVRNQRLYGDPLGWRLILAVNALRQEPLSGGDLRWLLSGLYRSFWLRWIGIQLDRAIYVGLGVVSLLAAAGLLRFIMKRDWEPQVPLLLSLLGLHIIFVFISLIRWTMVVLGTDQARLLYPALSAIVLLLFLGLAHLVSPHRVPLLAGAVATGMFLLAAASPFRYIKPIYAPPPILSLADLPPLARPTRIDFGHKIRLLGYELSTDRAQSGQTIRLDLYWQSLEGLDKDYWLLIQLLDENDQFLMYKDGSPSAGRYATDFWQAGDIIPSQHNLLIPDYAQSGRYRLELRMHPFGSRDWLPIFDERASLIGDRIVIAEVIIAE